MGSRVVSIPAPGIRSVNGVEASGSTLTLVSSNNSIIFTPDNVNKTLDLQVVTEAVGSPVIENISLANVGQEYNVTLPVETRKFSFRLRFNGVLQYSYTSGGPFFTMPPGTIKEESNLSGAFLDIYVKSSSANNILELEYWV